MPNVILSKKENNARKRSKYRVLKGIKQMKKIILVRHGSTEYNESGIIQVEWCH